MATKLRCAIYTRKSSEEGLEQDFNSLHAQREACEAYVLSQRGEGWTALKRPYDDGGFSGGNMDRPALRQLLADIDAGLVDIVVVYKVDRITRSLGDFARIVEVFDRRGVSFVSVTQAFNTTSSMGRLTLNVLLSFAQFEREVTGERIRDKIAQSKARGMWMGGMPPLGYDARDRKLEINAAEAAVVRHIFGRYLALGSTRLLAEELERDGYRSKAWETRSGGALGGRVLSRGALIHILKGRVYVGEIVHGDKVHPGLHEAIIARDMFDAVQTKMAGLARVHHERPVRAQPGVLLGKLFDANGERMSPTFAYGKQKQLYRYYMPVSWQTRRKGQRGDSVQGRISADALEGFLVSALQRFTGRTTIAVADLAILLSRVELRSAETHIVLDREALFPGDHPDLVLAGVRRRSASDETAVLDRGDASIRIVLPHRLQLRGGRASVRGAEQEVPRRIDRSVVKALRRGHADLLALKASPLMTPEDLVDAATPETAHERQIARLALMSPSLQRRIMEGDHPSGLALRQLLKCPMPLAWADQANLLEDLGRSEAYRVRP
jgi:DNA invertase Pin-like site-specific DNA recombinase